MPESADRPKTLFKYVSPDRVDILENLNIRYTQAAALNDIFEMDPVIARMATEEDIRRSHDEVWPNLRKATFERVFMLFPPEVRAAILSNPEAMKQIDAIMPDVTAELSERLEQARPEVVERIRKELIDRIGALSFSEDWDHLVMWAHYAQQHEGFVIEFKPTHQSLNQTTEGEFGHLRQVTYLPQRPQLILARTEGADVFLTKCAVWTYEKEWRILRPLDGLARIGDDPAKRPVYLGPLDPGCIKAVILGLKASDRTRARVVAARGGNPGLANVVIEEAHADDREYTISRHAI